MDTSRSSVSMVLWVHLWLGSRGRLRDSKKRGGEVDKNKREGNAINSK